MPGVSVIVPLYNKAPYIPRLLASILCQTCEDFDVLVIDDGSRDGGAELVRACPDARVRLLTQANGGVSAARNRGIAESSGALIAFLDADDEWLPPHLAALTALHARFPRAGALGAAYAVEQPSGALRTPAFPLAPTESTGGLLDYFAAPHLWTSATAVTRAALAAVGGFQAGVRYGEDMDLWVRIALRYPVAWSPTVSAIYHHSEQAHNCRDKFYVGDAPFAAPCERFVGELGTPAQRRVYELLCSQRLRTFAVGTYLAGDRPRARRMVRACGETRVERKRYWGMRALTALPVPLGRAAYRLIRRDWRPWQFIHNDRVSESEGRR